MNEFQQEAEIILDAYVAGQHQLAARLIGDAIQRRSTIWQAYQAKLANDQLSTGLYTIAE